MIEKGPASGGSVSVDHRSGRWCVSLEMEKRAEFLWETQPLQGDFKSRKISDVYASAEELAVEEDEGSDLALFGLLSAGLSLLPSPVLSLLALSDPAPLAESLAGFLPLLLLSVMYQPLPLK